MAYQKQNFLPNTKLYSRQLNHIEDGIAANEQEIKNVRADLNDLVNNVDKKYTNIFKHSEAKVNTAWEEGKTISSNGIVATGKMPCVISMSTNAPTILRIKGYTPWGWKDPLENIQYFDAAGNYLWFAPIKNGTQNVNYGFDENGDFYVYLGWASETAVHPNATNFAYFAVSFQVGDYQAITDNSIKNIEMTIDEPMVEDGGSSAGALFNKKVLVIGDSISTDAYGNYKKWVTDLVEDKFFPQDITNSSYHATGFVATYNEGGSVVGKAFLDRLKAIQNKDTFNYVIVFGGINDYIQNIAFDTFTNAVNAFFEYLTKNFLNARILILSPLRTYNIYNNTVGKQQQEYSAKIREVAKSYCLPVLNLTEDSGFYPFVTEFKNKWTLVPSGYTDADGVHPNEEYSKKFLAPMIKKFIEMYC